MIKITDELRNRWLESYKEKKLRKKAYLHFDPPISPDKAVIFATNPYEVTSHSFYPFIHWIEETPRYKKDEEGLRHMNLKKRDLYKAAHADSAIFSWYAFILEQCYEQKVCDSKINDVVIAYRTLRKSSYDFANEAFTFIQIAEKPISAMCYDIESFFDRLDHGLLLEKCTAILGRPLLEDELFVLNQVTKFNFVKDEDTNVIKDFKDRYRLCSPSQFRTQIGDNNLIQKNEKIYGIAQGTPISAILSNIYLFDFDKEISRETKNRNALYRRYSDDILLACKNDDSTFFEKLVLTQIDKMKLQIQKAKTVTTMFKEAPDGKVICVDINGSPSRIQYLGLEFDGENIFIRSSTIARNYRRTKTAAHSHKKLQEKSNKKISKKKLFYKYTHLGNNNFYSYIRRVEKATSNSKSRKQMKKHVAILKNEINKGN